VGPDGSFAYRNLESAEEGVPDEQLLPGFAVAVARVATKPGQSDPFGLTTHRMWVPLRDLGPAVAAPNPLAFDDQGSAKAWVLTRDAPLFKSPGGARLPGAKLGRLSSVRVLEQREKSREVWLRIEGDAWLRGRDATWAVTRPPPAEALVDERWIDVDLARQVVTAYRGGEPQFSLLASTGRGPAGSELATPPGVHRLWIKLESSDMDNLESTDASRNYAIQAVPWVMYFDHGYGLHGAFWHDDFGHVHSHGCVNLTPADAERLFAWTSPRLPAGWSAVFPTSYERGTLVRVE
jgi:hypothetical protein